MRWSCLFLVLLSRLAESQDGAAIYRKACAGCHDSAQTRAPDRNALKQMYPERIVAALISGKMLMQGYSLTTAEVKAVSEFLAGKPVGSDPGLHMAASAYCSDGAGEWKDPMGGPRWSGWSPDPANTRFQTGPAAALTEEQIPRLKLKWAFAYPGDTRAYAQPAVSGGRLFMGSAGRRVYSLDASTGCIYWTFDADFSVRTALSVAALTGTGGEAVFFGDQHGNAYSLDAANGKLRWKVKIDEHPATLITGAPAVYQARLYVPASSAEEVFAAGSDYECCRFRGSVTALDLATGQRIWKSFTIPEEPRRVGKSKAGIQQWRPSGAGVWSSPTIDAKRQAVYVTTGDSYSDPAASTSDSFVAFDLETGKLLWSRQVLAGDAYNAACDSKGMQGGNCPQAKGPDYDFGSSPILVSLPAGGRALIAGQKSGMVHAVDPDHEGRILWQVRVAKGGIFGGVQWGSAADANNIYVAVSDLGWTKPGAGARPTMTGGMLQLDDTAGGGLTALRLATGEKVWSTPSPGCGGKAGCSPAQSAAVSGLPGVVFSGSLDGHLRAYATRDGHILWDVDTARDYQTVNGVAGSGGSLDGPGPVIAGGVLYVNSGYSAWGGMAGNVLLAFSVDGK